MQTNAIYHLFDNNPEHFHQFDFYFLIKINLSKVTLDSILDGETDVSPYIFVFCILFYLNKIQQYGDVTNLSVNENDRLFEKTTLELNNFKFLSISEKNLLLSQNENKEILSEMLNSFDNENIEIVHEILSGVQFISQKNVKEANIKLKAFKENMRWDLGFMLRVISIQYSQLKDTSVSNRKLLIDEIESLVKKYSDLPMDQNRIETY